MIGKGNALWCPIGVYPKRFIVGGYECWQLLFKTYEYLFCKHLFPIVEFIQTK